MAEVPNIPLPDGGASSIGDLISNPAISTPAGFALAVMGYIAQQYFKGRSEKRLDRSSDRESESGIVETTREALGAAREQIAEMRKERAEDRAYNEKLEESVRSLQTRLARAIRLVDGLQQDKEDLQRELDDERRRTGGRTQTGRGGTDLGTDPALSQIPGTERTDPQSRSRQWSPDTTDLWGTGQRRGELDGDRAGGRGESDQGSDGPGRHRGRSTG